MLEIKLHKLLNSRKSMNITLFIGSLYGGGAERVVCNLANYLQRKGHIVDILTMAESKRNYGLDENVHNTVLLREADRKNMFFNLIKRWKELKKYLKESNTDCYVVLLPITTIMLLLGKKYTNACIIAAERNDPSRYSKWKQLMLRSLAKRADGFIFQTQEIRNWYGQSVEDEKAVVIPNAINPAFIKPVFTGKKEKTIVGVGRLTEQKNFSMLIESFAEVHKKFPDYQLIIYGDGPLKESLIAKATELGIADNVNLPGNEKDIISKLESASMFVLSSKFEGMPNALMEAMALGLPCVSTDCGGGGARFLIDNNVNGLLVQNENVDELANAMMKLLNDEELAGKLAAEAHKISEKLAPDVIYSKWENVIKASRGE